MPLQPAEALALWTDVDRWPTFIEGFARVVERSPGWPAEGERVSWESSPGGRGRVTEKVVERGADRFSTMVFESALMGRQTLRAVQHSVGAEVELSLEYTLTKYGPAECRGGRSLSSGEPCGTRSPHGRPLRRGGRGGGGPPIALHPPLPPEVDLFVFKAAVVGAGTMGGEIAQVVAAAGIPVVLKDVKQEFVDTGLEKARQVTEAQLGVLVGKEKITQEQADAQREQLLGRITGTTGYEGFGDVDFVIEAVPERMEIKQTVFAELDEVTPGHAILASNTSSLSVTEMSEATLRPDKVCGFHSSTRLDDAP